MEAWHECVFKIQQKEPAPNAIDVTMHQLKEADKMFFRKLAERTGGALAQRPDGSNPIEPIVRHARTMQKSIFASFQWSKEGQEPMQLMPHPRTKRGRAKIMDKSERVTTSLPMKVEHRRCRHIVIKRRHRERQL